VGKSSRESKSFQIPKRLVWEAYQRVKANKGAAGVDGQSVEEFEEDLKNNLYRIWNRMSSGTYFPPPVRAVEIPKPHGGGTRMLGIPTVADRVAQTVVALQLEPRTESIFHDDSYGYRPGRSPLMAVKKCRERCWKKDWVLEEGLGAGRRTGCWTSMSRSSSTQWTMISWSRRWRPTPTRNGWCCM
jgi:retron-type reverse transcriptase